MVRIGPRPPGILELRELYRRNWRAPITKPQSLLEANRFRFLNEIHELNRPGDWNNPAISKLWLYNAHYFDDLAAENAGERSDRHTSLINRWVRENPPAIGNGWEPYPISIRAVNWIKWSLKGNTLPERPRESLACQVEYLNRCIEWHILANHVFANAKALLFGGLFFGGKQAEAWLGKGVRILRKQLQEQILADGGHFERSPMYHAIILEDILDIVNIIGTAPPSADLGQLNRDCRRRVPGMLDWLHVMSHPDGNIALFNDAAFGVASTREALRAYARRLEIPWAPAQTKPVRHLESSGYVAVRSSEFALFINASPIEPSYQPGHSHADTLSFELSIGGKRCIVDSGTSCYGNSAERLRQRSTAAHNTVTVDGKDSSEVWEGFRVARRAGIRECAVTETDGELTVAASHDGYRRLRGAGVHRRTWTVREKEIIISDTIEGKTLRRLDVYFHLHPELTLVQEGNCVDITHSEAPRCCARLFVDSKLTCMVEEATYHPEFGLSQTNRQIHATLVAPLPRSFVTRILLR